MSHRAREKIFGHGGSAQNWTVNSNGTLTIDGGCMDITGAKYTNGTLIEWWTCNGGSNQKWTLP